MQVAEVCGVSPASVESTYAELHAELRDMLPPLTPALTEEAWDAFPTPSVRHMARQAGV